MARYSSSIQPLSFYEFWLFMYGYGKYTIIIIIIIIKGQSMHIIVQIFEIVFEWHKMQKKLKICNRA